MKIDGTCHCGKIAFEAEVNPAKVMICHCTDCQIMSGGPYRPLAPTEPGSFKITAGEPKIYVKTGDSGNQRQQAFCPDCGTPVYACPHEDNPQVHNIRLSAIRQSDLLPPQQQIWARSKLAWVNALSDLPETEKQ